MYNKQVSIYVFLSHCSSILNRKLDPGAKVKSDVERLWKIRCSLYKKEKYVT